MPTQCLPNSDRPVSVAPADTLHLSWPVYTQRPLLSAGSSIRKQWENSDRYTCAIDRLDHRQNTCGLELRKWYRESTSEIIGFACTNHTMDSRTPVNSHRGGPFCSNSPRRHVRYRRFRTNKNQLPHSDGIRIGCDMPFPIRCNASMCFVLSFW